MSEPAWVALGSRGGIVDWEGGWSAGVAYQPGDVVRWNGIDYIAVNPSTGQTPPVSAFIAGGYGTSLPASPVDGEEYTLVDSLTAPTYQWRFRYVSGITGANKWVFVGGADLLLKATGGVLPNGAYGSYGPTFAVPRAGVYNVAWGGKIVHPAGLYAYTDLYVAGASVSSMATYETAGWITNDSQVFRASVGTAAQTLAIYVMGAGASGTVDQIWMRVTPVAVA